MNSGAGLQMRNTQRKEDTEIYDNQRLTKVPDTLVAGGGTVTFKEHIVSRKALVPSTPHIKSHPSTINISGISSMRHQGKKQRVRQRYQQSMPRKKTQILHKGIK